MILTPDLLLRSKLTAGPTNVSISGSSARNSSALASGIYYITSDVDCFVLQGGASVAATTSSNRLWARERVRVQVDATGNAYLAAITTGATGTLSITEARGD